MNDIKHNKIIFNNTVTIRISFIILPFKIISSIINSITESPQNIALMIKYINPTCSASLAYDYI